MRQNHYTRTHKPRIFMTTAAEDVYELLPQLGTNNRNDQRTCICRN